MARYVFSLGLIPVQEWISEARRSRDLGAGSVFLCHVMAKVLARLERDAGAEVRIPVPPPGKSFQVLARESFSYALEWKYGIPNRASGTCEGEEGKVRRVFESLQAEVVDAEWEELKRYLSGSGWMEEERFWYRLKEWLRLAAVDLCWRDWQRWSNRQDRKMTLGGFVGTVDLEGDLCPFVPLLRTAEVVHVGKGATFGLGHVEAEAL